jgi:hypothetical protein
MRFMIINTTTHALEAESFDEARAIFTDKGAAVTSSTTTITVHPDQTARGKS